MTEENKQTEEAKSKGKLFYFRAPTRKQIEENEAAGLPPPIRRKSVYYEPPYLNADDIRKIANGDDPKQLELLIEAANDIIDEAVRRQLDEQPNYKEVDINLIDRSKLTWEYLAHMPRSERVSNTISEETWEEFKKDYVKVMVPVTGKPEQVVHNAAKIIAAEFKPVRDNRDKLAVLETYLDTWFANTERAADFASLYERLSKKVKDYQAKGLASLEI
jgi:hypothetical protein